MLTFIEIDDIEKSKRKKKGLVESLLRGGIQGLSFGFADEIQSALTGDDIDEIREEYDLAAQDNRLGYMMGEIGGSVAVPLGIAGAAIKPLRKMKNAALIGNVLEGGLSGAGYGTDMGSRLGGAGFGSALGTIGINAPGDEYIARRLSPTASKFIDATKSGKKFNTAMRNASKKLGVGENELRRALDVEHDDYIYKNTLNDYLKLKAKTIENVRNTNKDYSTPELAVRRTKIDDDINQFYSNLDGSKLSFKDMSKIEGLHTERELIDNVLEGELMGMSFKDINPDIIAEQTRFNLPLAFDVAADQTDGIYKSGEDIVKGILGRNPKRFKRGVEEFTTSVTQIPRAAKTFTKGYDPLDAYVTKMKTQSKLKEDDLIDDILTSPLSNPVDRRYAIHRKIAKNKDNKDINTILNEDPINITYRQITGDPNPGLTYEEVSSSDIDSLADMTRYMYRGNPGYMKNKLDEYTIPHYLNLAHTLDDQRNIVGDTILLWSPSYRSTLKNMIKKKYVGPDKYDAFDKLIDPNDNVKGRAFIRKIKRAVKEVHDGELPTGYDEGVQTSLWALGNQTAANARRVNEANINTIGNVNDIADAILPFVASATTIANTSSPLGAIPAIATLPSSIRSAENVILGTTPLETSLIKLKGKEGRKAIDEILNLTTTDFVDVENPRAFNLNTDGKLIDKRMFVVNPSSGNRMKMSTPTQNIADVLIDTSTRRKKDIDYRIKDTIPLYSPAIKEASQEMSEYIGEDKFKDMLRRNKINIEGDADSVFRTDNIDLSDLTKQISDRYRYSIADVIVAINDEPDASDKEILFTRLANADFGDDKVKDVFYRYITEPDFTTASVMTSIK